MSARIPAQPNQSIIAGITLLQEVVGTNRPVGSRELSRRLAMEHSRTNRILGTLVHMGLLRRDERRKYRAGPGIHVLSAQSLRASGLVPASIGALTRLQRLGATVALGTVWRDVVCYLIHARPGIDPASTVGAHETFPVDDSVIGALMAGGRRVIRWDRADRDEVSWASAVGEPAIAAIAAVFPASDARGRSEAMRDEMLSAAAEVEATMRRLDGSSESKEGRDGYEPA